VDLTVTVEVPTEAKNGDAGEVMSFIRSFLLKNKLQSDWIQQKYPGWGLSIRGGPRAVHATKDDRASRVTAYQQDYRLIQGF
jgi:hypothetical protein